MNSAAAEEGLAAVVAADRRRVAWLSKRLGEKCPALVTMRGSEELPKDGVVLMDLTLAKGLEFDHVIVPDAQADAYWSLTT